MTTTITSDFGADLVQIVVARLAAAGYPGQAFTEAREALIVYCELGRRLVAPCPRAVFKPAGFTCPPAQAAGLLALEGKIEEGHNLRPHLSRRLTDVLYQDPLLNEWGIHHFHLAETLDADGFVTRDGPILYARVTPDAVYFIWVGGHGSWEDHRLVQVLHDNWPESIAAFKSPAIDLERPSASPAERKALRSVGINALVQLADGSIYQPLGMGMTVAGHKKGSGKRKSHPRSIHAVRWAMRALKAVQDVEGRLGEALLPNLVAPVPELTVRLVEVDTTDFSQFVLSVNGEEVTLHYKRPSDQPDHASV